MEKTLLILLLLSSILFIDYVVLIAFGWSAFELGAQDQFYCGFYCKFAVSLLILSIVGAVLISKKISKKSIKKQ